MDDDLPSDYDTIVIGTGMPECILAAAFARNGKQVLHMDRHEYYGGNWATFSFDGLERWVEAIKEGKNINVQKPAGDLNHLLNDGETAIPCFYNKMVFNNIQSKSFIGEQTKSDKQPSAVSETESSKASHSVEKNDFSEGYGSPKPASNEPNVEEEIDIPHKFDVVASENNEKVEWSMEKIRALYRKFNLDIAPKLLFSRGELVDLLISSNIARYAEFKSITRVLTFLNGKLEQVPCSRADVFSTKNVTIVEKRMLMKLLTFCLKFEAQPQEYQGFEDRTFLDFLKSRKLTPNVQHYVLHAIAMVSDNTLTLEGLKATQKFLNSLGRYGNTPFLWPLYGSGELPQCFCRLCAVFGGIYYLKREVDAIVLDSENKCQGIISRGKRLNCRWLVLDVHFAPQSFCPINFGEKQISRAILLTNKSILPADKEQLTFMRLPAGNGLLNPVWVVELGSAAMACPSDLYVVHLTCDKTIDAENDLKVAVELLFNVKASSQEASNTIADGKPEILWCIYFNQQDSTHCDLNSLTPENVFLTSGPNGSFDLDDPVLEAKKIFKSMFHEEEFLPRAPDPEDIVVEDAEEATPERGFSSNIAEVTVDAASSDKDTKEPQQISSETETKEIETEDSKSEPGDQSINSVENENPEKGK